MAVSYTHLDVYKRQHYTMSVPAKNKWGILVYKTKRMLHTHRACNSVLRISLCKWVGHSILLHLDVYKRPVLH